MKPFNPSRSSEEPMSTAAAGTTVLELRDVSKSFGPVVALRSGSLTVEAGSVHALVGENGAGKSTLFPDLAVTENIFMGRMPVAGRRIDKAAMYREATALFQRLGVHIDPRR